MSIVLSPGSTPEMMVPVLYTVLVMVLATVPDKLDLSLLNMSMIFVLEMTKPVNTKLSLFCCSI